MFARVRERGEKTALTHVSSPRGVCVCDSFSLSVACRVPLENEVTVLKQFICGYIDWCWSVCCVDVGTW